MNEKMYASYVYKWFLTVMILNISIIYLVEKVEPSLILLNAFVPPLSLGLVIIIMQLRGKI
jgi:hypothetical protein